MTTGLRSAQWRWTGRERSGSATRQARFPKGAGSESLVIAELAGDDREIVTGLCTDRTGRLWGGTSHGLLGHIEEERFVALEDRLSHW